MKVLFVSSEIFPLAKTGGLADVAGFLSAALEREGVEVRLLMPAYRGALDRVSKKRVRARLGDPLGLGDTRLIAGHMPDSGLAVWLIDCPPLYDRPGDPYRGPDGRDWPDNHLRFAHFGHMGALLAGAHFPGGWRGDVVHANDWQTGLIPALLAARGSRRPPTLFTIHNLAYQGVFPSEVFPSLGLHPASFAADGVEFHGQVSFLKAGLHYSTRLTTVSPNYSREIRTPEFGCGLEGLLARRAGDLDGILNGVDYGFWNPATDPYLNHPFDARNLAGKGANKIALQDELGLDLDAGAPLIAAVARLAEQKGLDLVLAAAPGILARGGQLVLMGDGDMRLGEAFRALARADPRRIAALPYEERMVHRVLGGADLMLSPSRFEPCGLTHLYGFRYGVAPVVHRVGGLADTVRDTTAKTLARGTASGFVFDAFGAEALLAALDRALDLFHRSEDWRNFRRRLMGLDFGWTGAARRYADIYRQLAPEAAASDARRREKVAHPREVAGDLGRRLEAM